MPTQFDQLTSRQLEGLSRSKTVFFFPVGPLEDHGPHLPLGLDVAEAQALCRLTAERVERELGEGWTGVIMPAAPLGLESNTSAIALTVRPHVLRDWLVDACRALTRAGFLHYVCYSGHTGPRTLTAIEDAAKIFNRRGLWVSVRRGVRPTLVSPLSGLTTWQSVRKAPFFLDPPEHGGKRDTSVALATGATVDPTWSALPGHSREGSAPGRWLRHFRGGLKGYWGEPSQATPEAGRAALAATVDAVFPKLRAVWEGANPNHLFRSWYSILPPNKSFFKAWLIAFFVFLILVGWIFFNVKYLLQ